MFLEISRICSFGDIFPYPTYISLSFPISFLLFPLLYLFVTNNFYLDIKDIVHPLFTYSSCDLTVQEFLQFSTVRIFAFLQSFFKQLSPLLVRLSPLAPMVGLSKLRGPAPSLTVIEAIPFSTVWVHMSVVRPFKNSYSPCFTFRISLITTPIR